jgi:hypothetical protein
MPDKLPVYLPGDTINFTVELDHDLNIGDGWAAFRRHPQEGEATGPIRLEVNAQAVEERGGKLEVAERLTLPTEEPATYRWEGDPERRSRRSW